MSDIDESSTHKNKRIRMHTNVSLHLAAVPLLFSSDEQKCWRALAIRIEIGLSLYQYLSWCQNLETMILLTGLFWVFS
jgi:hypothetical protein